MIENLNKEKNFIKFPNGEIKIHPEFDYKNIGKNALFLFDGKDNIFEQQARYELLCNLFQDIYYIRQEGLITQMTTNYSPFSRADKTNLNNMDVEVYINTDHQTILGYHRGSTALRTKELEAYIFWETVMEDESFYPHDSLFVFPDKGASDRFKHLFQDPWTKNKIAYITKERDKQGKLTINGIKLPKGLPKDDIDTIYIIDDIISKGGTFIGVEKILRKEFPGRYIDTEYFVFYNEETKPQNYPLNVKVFDIEKYLNKYEEEKKNEK